MFLQVSVILLTGGCLVPGESGPGGGVVPDPGEGPGGDPSRRLLLRAVCILLECILVLLYCCRCFSVMSHESRPEFYLPTLPALVRICKVFPPLCGEAFSLLLQLGRVSASHLASISNSTGKGGL